MKHCSTCHHIKRLSKLMVKIVIWKCPIWDYEISKNTSECIYHSGGENSKEGYELINKK